MEITKPPATTFGYLCAGCGTERQGVPAQVCPDCLEKASQFNGFLEEAAADHEDTIRLNTLEAERYRVGRAILITPNKTVREILDQFMEK